MSEVKSEVESSEKVSLEKAVEEVAEKEEGSEESFLESPEKEEILGDGGESEEEESPMGLPQHLNMLADELLSVSRQEEDQERKDECYTEILGALEDDANDIHDLVKMLEQNENMSLEVREICSGIDMKFLEAAGAHLEAIDLMIQFTESEDDLLIEQAKELIEQGTNFLEQADAMGQSLIVFRQMDPGTEA